MLKNQLSSGYHEYLLMYTQKKEYPKHSTKFQGYNYIPVLRQIPIQQV